VKKVEIAMSVLQDEIAAAQDDWAGREGAAGTTYKTGRSYRLVRPTQELLDALKALHDADIPTN
jgi:hypothetical protein